MLIFVSIFRNLSVFMSMEITRFIIWTTNIKDTKKLVEILDPKSSIIVSISDRMVCIEAKLTTELIRKFIGPEMEMACLEMKPKFIEKLLRTKFVQDEKKNFIKFLELTKVPLTIDEALDLINERGGVEFLSERELSTLNKLTNKH